MIVTAAPAYEPLAALRGGERFPKGAHLLLIHEGDAEPLVAEFAASADASVSFDGAACLFAGKKSGRRSVADMGTDAEGSQGTAGNSADEAMRSGRCICRAGGLFMRCERRSGFQLQSARLDGVEGARAD